jgi:hypothetical protein
MNYSKATQQTQSAITRLRQRNVFANNWEQSAKNVSALAIPTKTAKSLRGGDDTFLAKSNVLPELLEQVNLDDISLTDLVMLSQAAKAIEDGDTKAAVFLRDSAGCKPTDKVPQKTGNIGDLTDDELEFLLAHAEVVDETD